MCLMWFVMIKKMELGMGQQLRLDRPSAIVGNSGDLEDGTGENSHPTPGYFVVRVAV